MAATEWRRLLAMQLLSTQTSKTVLTGLMNVESGYPGLHCRVRTVQTYKRKPGHSGSTVEIVADQRSNASTLALLGPVFLGAAV